jgi:hypothetical protein
MPAEHLEKIGLENVSNELMQAHDLSRIICTMRARENDTPVFFNTQTQLMGYLAMSILTNFFPIRPAKVSSYLNILAHQGI